MMTKRFLNLIGLHLKLSLLIFGLALSSIGHAQTESGVNKAIEACLNKNVKIETCQAIQETKKNLEKIGHNLAEKYGQNPILIVAGVATQRRLEIENTLPISIDNKIIIDPQQILLSLGFEF